MKSITTNIRYRFIITNFLAMDLSVADFAATEIPLLTISNGKSDANNQQRIFRCQF